MKKLILAAAVLATFSSPVLAAEPDPLGDVATAVEGFVMIPVNLVVELTK
jgi:hypothetical protein